MKVKFKNDEKIAFNGLEANFYSSEQEHDLTAEQIEKLEGWGVEFEAFEDNSEEPKKKKASKK